MEPLTETIDLDLEESNDLTFKIRMEGSATAPAKVRLVCEGNDFAYMFSGYGTGEDEVVQFTLPRMDNKIKEGLYNARVEVLVENRYFAPLQFQINFKKTLSVVAESIQVVRKVASSDIKVTASPITVARPVVPVSTIKFEQRPQAPVQAQAPAPVAAPAPKIQVEQKPATAAAPIQAQNPSKFSLKDAYMKKVTEGKPADVLDKTTVNQITRPTLRDKFGK